MFRLAFIESAPGGELKKSEREELARLREGEGRAKLSENTVAKRMAELGLAGRRLRRSRSLARQGKWPAAPDLVRRKFTAVAADVLWAATPR